VELDNLKALWQETDRRLESVESLLRLQQRAVAVGTRDSTRSKLWPVRLVLWYEVAFAALATMLVGSYLADNIRSIPFAAPATLLQLVAIGTLGFAVYQLVALAQIDYTGPVVAIQRRLARLRVVRARANRWLLLSAPLLWALLVIVVPHGLLGVDIYRLFGLAWVIGNLAVGVAVIGAAALVSRWFPAIGSSAFVRGIGDDMTGRRVADASAFLDELAQFEAAEG
jgi:serine/threonine-protein kinase